MVITVRLTIVHIVWLCIGICDLFVLYVLPCVCVYIFLLVLY